MLLTRERPEMAAHGILWEGLIAPIIDSRQTPNFGRAICVTAECKCVSRFTPDGKGAVGEGAPKEAWPRALSQYSASWASCFDGGFAATASNTELAVSRALSRSISSDAEESKDVRRSYAACERYGCESFGRYNKWLAKVLRCSSAIH